MPGRRGSTRLWRARATAASVRTGGRSSANLKRPPQNTKQGPELGRNANPAQARKPSREGELDKISAEIDRLTEAFDLVLSSAGGVDQLPSTGCSTCTGERGGWSCPDQGNWSSQSFGKE